MQNRIIINIIIDKIFFKNVQKNVQNIKPVKNCLKQSSDFYRSVCLCAGGVARCSSVLTSPWQIQDNKNFQVPMLSPLDQVFSGSDFSDSVQQGDKKNYNFGVVSLRTFLWQGWTTSCLYLCFTWKCRRVEVKKVVKQKFSFSSRVYLAVHTPGGSICWVGKAELMLLTRLLSTESNTRKYREPNTFCDSQNPTEGWRLVLWGYPVFEIWTHD